MACLRTELAALRKLLPDPKRNPPVMLSIVLDGDVPEWATEAIRPYAAPEGVTIITWRQSVDGDIYAGVGAATVADTVRDGERWYYVTPAGCEPIEEPETITFTAGPPAASLEASECHG